MKNLKTYRAKNTRADFRTTAPHIHALRFRAFLSEGVDLTEKENAHFDVCRLCRLKMIAMMKDEEPEVERTITSKAA